MTRGWQRRIYDLAALPRPGVGAFAWALLVLFGFIAACARHESKELATSLAPPPVTPTAAGSSAGGNSGVVPVPAQAPVDDATRAAVGRKHEMIAEADREKARGEPSEQALGAEQRKAWEEEQRRVAAGAWTTAASTWLSGAFTREAVIRAAGVGSDPASIWLISEWHAQPATLVALSFHPVEFGYPLDKLDPSLVLLQASSGNLALLAKQKLDLRKANCSNESGQPPGGWDEAPKFALDLAAYAIAPGQTAIGVRLTCMYTFPAGQGIDTWLFLLEPKAGKLRQIFEASIAHENFDRPSANETKATGVLLVQPTQHAGYFDLQLRTKLRIQGGDPEAFPNTAREPSERIETERFVWKGDHYVAEKAR
jgi:hypothetical protein